MSNKLFPDDIKNNSSARQYNSSDNNASDVQIAILDGVQTSKGDTLLEACDISAKLEIWRW